MSRSTNQIALTAPFVSPDALRALGVTQTEYRPTADVLHSWSDGLVQGGFEPVPITNRFGELIDADFSQLRSTGALVVAMAVLGETDTLLPMDARRLEVVEQAARFRLPIIAQADFRYGELPRRSTAGVPTGIVLERIPDDTFYVLESAGAQQQIDEIKRRLSS